MMRAAIVFSVAALVVSASPLPATAAADLQVAYVTTDEASGNQRLAPGERTEVWVDVKNSGSSDAHDVRVELRTSSPSLDILEPGPIRFGTVGAGDIKYLDETDFEYDVGPISFRVRVAPDAPCPSQPRARFVLTSDEGTREDPFELDVACAAPTIVDDWNSHPTYHDAETGEEIRLLRLSHPTTVEIPLANVGEAPSPELSATLSSAGPVTIVEPTATVAPMDGYGGQASATFTVTVNECRPSLRLDLHVVGDGIDADVFLQRFEVACAVFDVRPSLLFDDATTGNGDGAPQAGETVRIEIRAYNGSSEAITGGSVRLALGSAEPAEATATIDEVRWLSEATVGVVEFVVSPDAIEQGTTCEFGLGVSRDLSRDEDVESDEATDGEELAARRRTSPTVGDDDPPRSFVPLAGTLTTAFDQGSSQHDVRSYGGCDVAGHMGWPAPGATPSPSPPVVRADRLATTGPTAWRALAGSLMVLAGLVLRRATRRASSVP